MIVQEQELFLVYPLLSLFRHKRCSEGQISVLLIVCHADRWTAASISLGHLTRTIDPREQ